VELIVAPDGAEADVLLNAGKAIASASATSVAAIEMRHPKCETANLREDCRDVELL